MSDLLTPAELVTMLLDTSRDLDAAQDELRRCIIEDARAEQRARRAKAIAYIAASGTEGARKAAVDQTTDEDQYAAHLADGMVKAAMEAVRSKRAQLSALQTMATSIKTELELAGRYST